MDGNIGLGHVRYSTTGASVAENAQPLVLSYIKGTLALAHNGNLINTPELKWELIQSGAIFHTTTDSEVIAFHIARERVHSETVEEAVFLICVWTCTYESPAYRTLFSPFTTIGSDLAASTFIYSAISLAPVVLVR